MSFPIGRIITLPRAKRALRKSGESAYSYIERHLSHDWGDVDPESTRHNELSLIDGNRVFSWYKLKTGADLWVITERGHSHTCVLHPTEYRGDNLIG